jgi:hypothetical protein
MRWKPQFSIRMLLILTIWVAHACAKPYFAESLHNSELESVSTWTPFVIAIHYSDAERMERHHETYLGAFGFYRLYSHETSRFQLIRLYVDVHWNSTMNMVSHDIGWQSPDGARFRI